MSSEGEDITSSTYEEIRQEAHLESLRIREAFRKSNLSRYKNLNEPKEGEPLYQLDIEKDKAKNVKWMSPEELRKLYPTKEKEEDDEE